MAKCDAVRCLSLLLVVCVSTCLAQYRGGSLHWEPVATNPRAVKFTLRTAWERTAGVYIKMVAGKPQPFIGRENEMYQPKRGDRIKVLGPETPKFIVSNGLLTDYLQLTVVSNTEQVLVGDQPGENLPHESRVWSEEEQTHWSYEGTNFFEGITEWEVELPNTEVTYVAEFQGCCRVRQMAPMQSNQGCIETRYGRGILQLCETSYFLRATVNLKYVPPPISFLPQILPFAFQESDDQPFDQVLELPILDYRATSKGLKQIPPQDVIWPEKVALDELEAGGMLHKPAPIVLENSDANAMSNTARSAHDTSSPAHDTSAHASLRSSHPYTSASAFPAKTFVSRAARHPLAHQSTDDDVVDLEPLPKFPNPPDNLIGVREDVYKVLVEPAVTGVSVRMLNIEKEQELTIYSGVDCRGNQLQAPPGSDICKNSFVAMHDCTLGKGRIRDFKCFGSPPNAYGKQGPSSSPVLGNVHSIKVPTGLKVQISDTCEISNPYNLDNATILGECDNANGYEPKCCNVTSAHARTFRAIKPSAAKKCVVQEDECRSDLSTSMFIHEALTVEYKEPSEEARRRGDNIVTTHLKRPGARRDLTEGNYPVTLLIGTRTSGTTMVEFVLKVLEKVGASQILPKAGGEMYNTLHLKVVDIPTNFLYKFDWQLTGELSTSGNVFFHTLDDGNYFFSGHSSERPQVVNVPLDKRDESRTDDDIPAHGHFTWTPCLADAGLYYYCMQAISIPAQDFSGATYSWAQSVCLKLRVVEDLPPKVSFYYKAKPHVDQNRYSLYMGQSLEVVVNASDNFKDSIDFVEISKMSINTGDELRARVTYVFENVDKAYRGVPVSKMPEFVAVAPPSFLNFYVQDPPNATLAAATPYQAEKIVSYTPTRMHSGLELQVCFFAVDNRGTCSKLGDWSERCMFISVSRCKYSMPLGQDLTYVAGLFQQNWIQLFALNPTYTKPETAVTTHGHIIHIGHLYNVSEGENVYNVMRRFGISEKSMMFVNADLTRQKRETWSSALPLPPEDHNLACTLQNLKG